MSIKFFEQNLTRNFFTYLKNDWDKWTRVACRFIITYSISFPRWRTFRNCKFDFCTAELTYFINQKACAEKCDAFIKMFISLLKRVLSWYLIILFCSWKKGKTKSHFFIFIRLWMMQISFCFVCLNICKTILCDDECWKICNVDLTKPCILENSIQTWTSKL